ncbi:MAG: nucleoside deaminase, partial [Megasphaera micronuciformis]
PMCAGAVVNSRLDRIVYGCPDPKGGGTRSLYTIVEDERLNHRAQVTAGVRADECTDLLKKFFQKRRADNTKTVSE